VTYQYTSEGVREGYLISTHTKTADVWIRREGATAVVVNCAVSVGSTITMDKVYHR